MNPTHASFFSGVGGLDMGLERAGWSTVSFSEIDPYASAVLAHHWPGVPNLGSIVDVVRSDRSAGRARVPGRHNAAAQGRLGRGDRLGAGDPDWTDAFLWTGGFPCQDLSVAGKRKGLAGERSGLAFAFLDLVERHQPPAIILENVPGLLSSHAGRDFGALLRRLGELGYGWAYRVLDARYFGVPQRRRRVFIVAIHARLDPRGDGPAEVLSVGSRCERHPATGGQPGANAADGVGAGIDDAVPQLLDAKGPGHNGADERLVHQAHVVGPSPDPGGVRAAARMAGRLDDRAGVAFVKGKRARSVDDDESWRADAVAPTLDSHRYRCCGNGVVAPVAEFIGARLRAVCEALLAEAAA